MCAVRQSQEKQINACLFAFRPAGWDNEKKIAILHENFTTVKPEDAYEDFIVKPPVRKLVHDKELAAEDEQVFLMKQQVRKTGEARAEAFSCMKCQSPGMRSRGSQRACSVKGLPPGLLVPSHF